MKGGADKEAEESVRARLEEVFNFERFPDWGKSGLPDMDQARKWVDEIFAYLRASTSDHYQEILRYFLLDSLDRNWKEHLLNMDHLRDGIGLRGYGQKDPKQEYKREGFELFSELIYTIKENALRSFSHLRIQAEVSDEEFKHEETDELQYTDSESAAEKKPETVRKDAKVSRNAPCPCGSGKKYKKCCGA
jgi:preprotein translocase subunit SecA